MSGDAPPSTLPDPRRTLENGPAAGAGAG